MNSYSSAAAWPLKAKEHFRHTDIRDTVTALLLCGFACSLPFDRFYSELSLILLVLHTMLYLTKDSFRILRIGDLIAPVLIYLLTLLGTLWTSFPGEAFSEWERQLAILIIPLCILLNKFPFYAFRLFLLISTAVIYSFTILSLYAYHLIYLYQHRLPVSAIFSNALLNHNFTSPIDMHATYFSMYIALSVTGLLIALQLPAYRKFGVLFRCMLVILTAGLIQLSSRAVLSASMLILITVVPFMAVPKAHRKRFLVQATGIIMLVAMLIAVKGELRQRYTIALKEDLTQKIITDNKLEPRMERWRIGWELIREAPVLGYGSGSEVALLKQEYWNKKFYRSFLAELNMHNQFLSMWMKTGIAGLLVLLFVYYTGCRKAWQLRDPCFLAFMLLTIAVSFSENVLDGNKGIFFFAFYFSVFYQGSLTRK
jgi:O-antigen ligase